MWIAVLRMLAVAAALIAPSASVLADEYPSRSWSRPTPK
jgi:hypothetical protein